MSNYLEVIQALDDYRLALFDEQQNEDAIVGAAAFHAQGASSAYATALTNVHATGVGIRVRGGKLSPMNLRSRCSCTRNSI